MSSTISVRYESNLIIIETFSGASSDDNTIRFDGLNTLDTLTASTTVPVTKFAYFSKALSTGTGTIDLTALPGRTADETIDGTGLKVQAMKLLNPSTNANKITVTKGGSSGYGLGAAGATWTIPLDPGQEVQIKGDDTNPDVGGSAKNIDLTGTGSQALSVEIVLG